MLEDNIKIDKGELIVFFDTKIYPSDAVLKASEKFTENFWTFVDGDKSDKIILKIKPKSGKAEKEIAFEFYNFALAMIKESGGA